MSREVTPSVTLAGVPSGGIQKLYFFIENLENTKVDIKRFNFQMFYSIRVIHTRPDPGHDDNQDRGDVGGKEKMA